MWFYGIAGDGTISYSSGVRETRPPGQLFSSLGHLIPEITMNFNHISWHFPFLRLIIKTALKSVMELRFDAPFIICVLSKALRHFVSPTDPSRRQPC